jgi:hypothetical protein
MQVLCKYVCYCFKFIHNEMRDAAFGKCNNLKKNPKNNENLKKRENFFLHLKLNS